MVQPHRLILIAIGTLYLAGLDLTQPSHVVMLRVHAPARMVGAHKQRILLGSFGADSLLVADAFCDPLRHRWPLEIRREVLEKAGGLELELTGRCRKWILLRVLVEIVEAGGYVLPIIGCGHYVVSLLVKLLPANEVVTTGSFPAVFDQLGDGLATGVLLQQPQALSDLAYDLVVTVRLAERLYTLVLREQQVVLAAEDVDGDVVLFELGVHRQDDIGHQTVILQPRVLGEHELDVGMAHGPDVVVAHVPACDPRWRVGPDHVDLGAAIRRVLVVHELIFAVGRLAFAAPPVALTLENSLGYQRLRDKRGVVGLIRVAAGVGLAQVGYAQRLGLSVLIWLVKESPLYHLGLVGARLTKSLHGQADALQAGWLGSIGATNAGATVANNHGSALARPLLGQCFDHAGWHASDGCRPLGRLGHSVLFAHDVGLVLLDANGVSLEVILFVRSFLEPVISNCEIQRRVGVWQDRDPPVGVHSGGIVKIRAYVDLLDAEFRPPVA
ncbi:hypothetical protein ES703_125972 [subsurface metagenome]